MLQIKFDSSICVSYVYLIKKKTPNPSDCILLFIFGEWLKKVTVYNADFMVMNATVAGILQ